MKLLTLMCAVGLTMAAVVAGSASADPILSPNALIEDVNCDLDGNGAYETHFDVVGLGTAGHDLGSTSINVAMSADYTIYDADGNVVRTGSFVTPGVGLATTSCTWTAQLPGGATMVAEGDLLFTPAQP